MTPASSCFGAFLLISDQSRTERRRSFIDGMRTTEIDTDNWANIPRMAGIKNRLLVLNSMVWRLLDQMATTVSYCFSHRPAGGRTDVDVRTARKRSVLDWNRVLGPRKSQSAAGRYSRRYRLQGGRLPPHLLGAGYAVRCLVRSPASLGPLFALRTPALAAYCMRGSNPAPSRFA